MGEMYVASGRAAWPTTVEGVPVLDTNELIALARERVPTLDIDELAHAIDMYGGDPLEVFAEEADPQAEFLNEAAEAVSQTLVYLADEIASGRLHLEFDGRRWWLAVHDLHHESGDYSDLLRSVDLIDDSAVGVAPVGGETFFDTAMTAAALACADTVVQAALSALRASGASEEQLETATAALDDVRNAPVQVAGIMRTAYDSALSNWAEKHNTREVVHVR